MFKLYNYCCAAVFWKLRRRQIAEFPLGLARVDGLNLLNRVKCGKCKLEELQKHDGALVILADGGMVTYAMHPV